MSCLFSACQIKDLKRRYRSVSCPARLALRQADTGTLHRLTHLNLRDISTHLKLEDKIKLHKLHILSGAKTQTRWGNMQNTEKSTKI